LLIPQAADSVARFMQALTGFRDFYPDDCAFRNGLFVQWRAVARRHGFVEYDGPPLEELELYTKKSGDEIVGQLYHFKDKGERAVALRPEMTPTLARMVAARHRDFKKPLKWFSIPQVFRYERPQKGRLREHIQFNADIIGEPGLEADVELIALAINLLTALGLKQEDFVVRLSDRQFWTDFLKERGIPESEWYAVFQAIDKSERDPREKTVERLGVLAEPVLAILEKGGSNARLETVEAGLAQRGLGGFVKKDLTVVRGLAYYTGIVFEVFDRSGEFRAIAGGGRYDDLLKNLAGTDLPALGFGMGDVVLGEMLKSKNLAPQSGAGLDVFLVIPDEAWRPKAMGLLQDLRQAGVAVDYPFGAMKMGKQFELAEGRGARWALIVDAKAGEDMAEVKELATREQRALPISALADFFKSSKVAPFNP
jgi:histidyl-tRNA synthetase